MANAGKLDRRIEIQQRELTKDTAGGNVETWKTTAFCWAQKIDQRGKESEVVNADKASSETLFRMRYKPWLNTSDYQIIYRKQRYDITHIKEEGRSDSQLVTATETEGIA